jgi:GNAT superfamily N-acetyltransferase
VCRELFLKDAMAYRSAFTTDEREGVALWTPPGKGRLGAMEKLRLMALIVRLSGLDLPRALRALSGMKSRRPREPHWYLSILGVEPSRRGADLDSALLQPVLNRCDADGLGAYVEATTPRNRDLHLRQGFAVLNEIALPGGGPPVWRMWRGPAPA